MADQNAEGLLDTSAVVDLARAKAIIGLPGKVVISAITVAELNYGVALAATRVEAVFRAERNARLRAWIEPLPFDELAADKYGELVALVRAHGRQPRPSRLDLMIAATAVRHNLPLYTFNGADLAGLESVLTVVAPEPGG
ncbi:MAG: type II toxin-antitoxin system VapC family toxin [Bifidobacteriaceae bacterium]|nr:type II toxin-antitoxin system VapC family toxin [Bifidobacteriaceae bacterium]